MWDGIDRRRFPRAEYPCRLTIWMSGVPESVIVRTDNIGIGGIAVTITKELDRFTPVDLDIDLEDQQSHVHCQGRVIWVVKKVDPLHPNGTRFDTGIEFVALGDEDHQRLQTCIDRLSKRSNQTGNE